MSAEMEYFIYLLEYYAEYTKKSARDVLKEWGGKGITDTIFNGYFRYHQERIENAFEDIDSLLATGETRVVIGRKQLIAIHRGCSPQP